MKYRHEYKCQISVLDMYSMRQRLSEVMSRDLHAGPSGEYLIKSLYFDNYMDKALREKKDGLNIREKFRIRYYDDDLSFMRLEKKSKRNNLCNKVSVEITAEECERLINGDMPSVFDTDDKLKQELYAKMQYHLLRPKNIVTYNREAFIFGPGNVRVTFDKHIRGSGDIYGFLNPDTPMISLFADIILEIKWDEYLPQVIRDILQTNRNSISSFSKYVATRFI